MQLRDRGLSKHDAIIQGGATRLRPVLLTAMTTVLGLIPLTFGINIDFIGLLTEFKTGFPVRFGKHPVLGSNGNVDYQRSGVRNIPHACDRTGDVFTLRLGCYDHEQEA